MIVPGNHDAALLFPLVAQAVLDVIAAPGGRVDIAHLGFWRSADGKIYADHGHAFDKANRFVGWPDPVVSGPNGRTHLRRPSGEQFVQEYYNRYEADFPVIDNLASEGLGIRLALSAGNLDDIIAAAGNGIELFLFQMSWNQLGGFLGGPKAQPVWDVDQIKSQNDVAFLINSLAPDDPLRGPVERAAEIGALTLRPADLSDEEIRTSMRL